MKKITKSALWAGALFSLASTAVAKPSQDFEGVYAFGDEFSSTANAWPSYLSQRYGFNFRPGDQNFAVAHQVSTDLPVQLGLYNAAARRFHPNALYTLYVGARDYQGNPPIANGFSHAFFNTDLVHIGGFANLEARYRAGRLAYDRATFPATYANIDNRVAAAANFVQSLHRGGVNYTVVLNHFNEGLRRDDALRGGLLAVTPQQFLIAGEAAARIFNTALARALQERAPLANVVYVDYKRLVEEVSRRAASYFSPAQLALADIDYPFFDRATGQVPHAAAQRLTGQYVASILESPSQVALVREVPLSLGANIAQKTSTLASSFFLSDTEPKWTVDASAEFSQSRTGSFTKKELGFTNGKSYSGEIIANYRANKSILVGLRFSHAHSTLDFVANKGGAKLQETALSLHGAYKFSQPFFVYGSIGAGFLDCGIERKVALGRATHTHKGNPTGSHYFGTLGLGYRFMLEKSCDLALTPFVSGTYQEISLASYTEGGPNQSTTMSFNLPKRDSAVAEVGAALDAKFKPSAHLTILPSISVAYAHDFRDPLRYRVRARVSDMPREFTVAAYTVEPSYVNVQGHLLIVGDRGLSLGLHAGIKPTSRVKSWNVALSAGLKL